MCKTCLFSRTRHCHGNYIENQKKHHFFGATLTKIHHIKINNIWEQISYTGWPKKNATPTINNFKKTRDRVKKLCALWRIKFFSQQDDTKIINFDEGVLILWPFSETMSFSKFATSISKVTIVVPKIFHCWLPRVQCLFLHCKTKTAWMKRSPHYVTLQCYIRGSSTKKFVRTSIVILAHPSRRLEWAIAVRFRASSVVRRASSVVRRPSSVNFLHFHLLLENAWLDFNQTWQESSLGVGDSKLFK